MLVSNTNISLFLTKQSFHSSVYIIQIFNLLLKQNINIYSLSINNRLQVRQRKQLIPKPWSNHIIQSSNVINAYINDMPLRALWLLLLDFGCTQIYSKFMEMSNLSQWLPESWRPGCVWLRTSEAAAAKQRHLSIQIIRFAWICIVKNGNGNQPLPIILCEFDWKFKCHSSLFSYIWRTCNATYTHFTYNILKRKYKRHINSSFS